MPERLLAVLLALFLLPAGTWAARYQAIPAGIVVHDLNTDAGDGWIVVGYTEETDGSRRAAVSRYNENNQTFDRPTIDVPLDAQDSVVESIADGGSPRLLAGHYRDASGVTRPLVWPWGVGIPDPSDPVVLPPLVDGFDAAALAVNWDQLVVGWAVDADGLEYPVYWHQEPADPDNPDDNRLVWTIKRLPLPLGTLGGRATGVSPAGRVGGYAIASDGSRIALLWESGALDAQPRQLLDPNGRPAEVSDLSGQFISGWSLEAGDEQPLRWSSLFNASEAVSVLPGLGGSNGRALAVNARGDTVGESSDADGARRAFLYTDLCATFDLNRLLSVDDPFPQGGDWTLVSAHAVNEQNPPWIAVQGEDAAGTLNGFVLVPTETSPVDLRLTVSADKSSVRVGEPLTYTIEVENAGDRYATCVVVENRLYIGMTLIDVAADPGICRVEVYKATCVSQELWPGEVLRMTVRARPRPILVDREIVNVVEVSSGEPDLSPQDSQVETRTPVPREGCFIATAAYGSFLAPEVARLRTFRDRWLLPHAPGRLLVAFYYRHSPAWAQWLREHPATLPWVRAALAPVVWSVSRPSLFWGGLFFLAGAAWWMRRCRQRGR